MPMRGSEVNRDQSFLEDVARLRTAYPEIDKVVEQLVEVLKLDYDLPEIPVSAAELPHVYAVLVDYPPQGASGLQQFLLTYHATDPAPSPRTPYRTFTLLSIAQRKPR